jgi:stage V sporulation protein S
VATSHARGERDVNVLRVSSSSPPRQLAGAIAALLRKREPVHLQVIGAGALNQAVKAIAVARNYVSDEGLDPFFDVSFHQVDIDHERRTALRLAVELPPAM